MTDSPFAQIPNDIESIVALVTREALEECAAGACPIHPMLDACARDPNPAEFADLPGGAHGTTEGRRDGAP